jgi:hypothetical protein
VTQAARPFSAKRAPAGADDAAVDDRVPRLAASSETATKVAVLSFQIDR